MTVSIKNLTKAYGNFKAVDDITLTINDSEIFAFLGVNGAGKTTTLRMLAGVLVPTYGTINIHGYDLLKDPLSAKQITGYIPDRPYLYSKLTAKEFLLFVSDIYNLGRNVALPRIDSLLEQFSLTKWQHELIEGFSHGMKQRLATCASLVHNPKFLIVDEPMVGLDPHGAKLLKNSFKTLAKEHGTTIFLSTHSLNVAQELSDRLAIIHNGRIIALGSLKEIQELTKLNDHNLENIFLEITSSGDDE